MTCFSSKSPFLQLLQSPCCAWQLIQAHAHVQFVDSSGHEGRSPRFCHGHGRNLGDGGVLLGVHRKALPEDQKAGFAELPLKAFALRRGEVVGREGLEPPTKGL